MDRDEAIKRIRKALKARSGKAWSVTGGRGTAWGWINIDAPPARRRFDLDGQEGGSYASPAERAELAALLGLDRVHSDGVSIPASTAYRVEHVDRAEGRTPSVLGTPYWD